MSEPAYPTNLQSLIVFHEKEAQWYEARADSQEFEVQARMMLQQRDYHLNAANLLRETIKELGNVQTNN